MLYIPQFIKQHELDSNERVIRRSYFRHLPVVTNQTYSTVKAAKINTQRYTGIYV